MEVVLIFTYQPSLGIHLLLQSIACKTSRNKYLISTLSTNESSYSINMEYDLIFRHLRPLMQCSTSMSKDIKEILSLEGKAIFVYSLPNRHITGNCSRWQCQVPFYPLCFPCWQDQASSVATISYTQFYSELHTSVMVSYRLWFWLLNYFCK